MKIIVCIDDAGGMMFNHRRVSRDRAVYDDIAKDLGGGFLYASEYSRALLSDCRVPLMLSEDFLSEAGEGDICFVEDRVLGPFSDKIEGMTIYRWNRRYPSDLKLDVLPAELGLNLESTVEFAGNSHEKITKEIYSK